MTSTEGKRASVFYSPLGGAVFVELEDAAGNRWRLEVPENALPFGETITMQLCDSVKTDSVSGKQLAGVVFQPEGLQFTLPATLTVTGPAAEEETCVFYADGAGENLNFAVHEDTEKDIRISVSHFSAYIVYAPTDSSEIKEAQGLTVTALAASGYNTPADIVAGLSGKSAESVTAQKAETGKAYGTLANEYGVLNQFKSQLLEQKNAYLAEKVAAGTMTQERADTIIAAMEANQANCDGSCNGRTGAGMGAGLGGMNGNHGGGGRNGSGCGSGICAGSVQN